MDKDLGEESLVYAELGQLSFATQMNQVSPPDVEDSPIQYAQINHHLHIDNVSKAQNEPLLDKNHLQGMSNKRYIILPVAF